VSIEQHIDAQKAAEDAASESERRLVRAQKMEAIGQLAGGIAHDFNNLLTAILGYADLVIDAITNDPALTRDVEEIKKAGERAARLTRQLLAFSRQQRLEPQNVDLNHIVSDLVKMVGRVMGENIHTDVATDPALGLAKLDPGQIEQIVLNVVVNARDAMPQGGRLSIATANVELDPGFARLHPGAQAGPHVVLRVSDTGTGMAPEIVARIFEPFFTTKPLGQGTGLGLATVYGIVKQSNGYIAVESEVGAGTTFTIYFPRLSAETVETGGDIRGGAPLGGSETILVQRVVSRRRAPIEAQRHRGDTHRCESRDRVECEQRRGAGRNTARQAARACGLDDVEEVAAFQRIAAREDDVRLRVGRQLAEDANDVRRR